MPFSRLRRPDHLRVERRPRRRGPRRHSRALPGPPPPAGQRMRGPLRQRMNSTKTKALRTESRNRHLQVEGHCYRVSAEELKHEDAAGECAREGSSLAYIPSMVGLEYIPWELRHSRFSLTGSPGGPEGTYQRQDRRLPGVLQFGQGLLGGRSRAGRRRGRVGVGRILQARDLPSLERLSWSCIKPLKN